MARPTKLTPELHHQIVTYVQVGNYRKHAAAAVGVSERTMKEWMALGQKDRAKEPYKSFAAAIIKAEGIAITTAVLRLTEAFDSDPKLALEFLSRKAPQEWAQTKRLELSGKDGGPIQSQHSGVVMLPPEEDSESGDS